MTKESGNVSLEQVIQENKQGIVIMMELPADTYFEANSNTIKLLINRGFEGIYISFQRPFKNISSFFEADGIDIDKLFFIDAAAALSGEHQHEDMHCVHISQKIDIDELVKAICISLPKLKSKKRFVFIDSLTTITLYKPLSETIRFSEFLVRTVRKDEAENITLIFNVAKDLAQKRFIRDVAFRVDQVISVKNNG
jgi:KaiC/GvpD/RAD55 family RecA-like ATPase